MTVERVTASLDGGTAIDYDGPSGTVNYDDNGGVASDMVTVRVVDGALEDRDTIPAGDLV